jgi:predicted transcriptional regulator
LSNKINEKYDLLRKRATLLKEASALSETIAKYDEEGLFNVKGSRDSVEVERNGVIYKFIRGKVRMRAPSGDELSRTITMNDYRRSRKELFEVLGIKFKLTYPRREWNRFKRFFRIAKSLPCTVFVTARRVGVSKPTAYSYLNELLAWGIVKKIKDDECDQFKWYLSEEYIDREKLIVGILTRMNVKVKVFKRGRHSIKTFNRRRIRHDG